MIIHPLGTRQKNVRAYFSIAENQALEICSNPKGRFQGLDLAILKFKVEWYGKPPPNTHFPLFHPLGRGKEKRKVSVNSKNY